MIGPLTASDRERFDGLVAEAIEELPEGLAGLLEEMPLIVLDRPDLQMLKDLGFDSQDPELGAIAGEICGLHTGIANTEASVEHNAVLPSQVHLFREGVLAAAGGWRGPDGEDGVYQEIMVTLLHEIGHQMGLDEDDLTELGYD
ncbi:MAG: metallopeptidase family protein [Planctomycetota bacterium]